MVLALPVEQRVAPRPVKPGTLDLTASRLFLDNTTVHGDLVDLVAFRGPPIFITMILVEYY